jgi:myo-inositol-1(or 4)-monophosphatase
MTHSATQDLQLLQDAARHSGQIAMGYFGKDPEIWKKQGGSPVTEADMAVDDYLRQTLLRARPDYGWLSEETADTPDRLDKTRIFVVDPIDGTRGFINGDARWCVSIAIVEAGRPIAAVLMVPVQGRLMAASLGGGAACDGKPMIVSTTPFGAEALVNGPQSWLDGKSFQGVRARGVDYVPSLAYRFAQVGLGEIDAAFSKPNAHDWDLAACDLLVHEAGGRLTDLQERAPQYNRAALKHGVLAAGNAVAQPQLVKELTKT